MVPRAKYRIFPSFYPPAFCRLEVTFVSHMIYIVDSFAFYQDLSSHLYLVYHSVSFFIICLLSVMVSLLCTCTL